MAEVVWLDSAQRDVEEIFTFIARDSRQRAERMIARIEAAAADLERFPGRGRRVPELPDMPYREVIVEPYRLIYRHLPARNIVAVLAVVHGRRLLPPIPDIL